MPSSMTHSYFMRDVCEKLDSSINKKIMLEFAIFFNLL